MRGCDVVIVGGAAMGSAVAYHLARLEPDVAVVVVERDPSYRLSSTMRCDGNVRVQFNCPENILMSLHALEVLETFADDLAVGEWRPEPGARHQGNLFLTDDAGRVAAEAGLAAQHALGAEVEWLEPPEIAARWPDLAGDGFVGGTYGPVDGAVDPNALLQGYRRAAMALGVEYVEAEVVGILGGPTAGAAVAGVRLADRSQITAPVVVNCAGAWCGPLAASVGVDLPVTPVMRSVFTVRSHVTDPVPSIFLPNGLYALPEHDGTFLVSWSRDTDPEGFDFSIDRDVFNDVVWPELATSLPAFEELSLTGGWAGVYEVNTFDGNGIIGEWPERPGLFLANGFSGHGFQQAPAVGRHLAELIVGLPPSLDLARLAPDRILAGEPYRENPGRII